MMYYEVPTEECVRRINRCQQIMTMIREKQGSASLSGIEYYQPEVDYLKAVAQELSLYEL